MTGDALLDAVHGAGGDQLHDPGSTGQGFIEIIERIFVPQLAAYVMPMAYVVFRWSEESLVLCLELAADHPIKHWLTELTIRATLGGEANNAYMECRASASITLR